MLREIDPQVYLRVQELSENNQRWRNLTFPQGIWVPAAYRAYVGTVVAAAQSGEEAELLEQLPIFEFQKIEADRRYLFILATDNGVEVHKDGHVIIVMLERSSIRCVINALGRDAHR